MKRLWWHFFHKISQEKKTVLTCSAPSSECWHNWQHTTFYKRFPAISACCVPTSAPWFSRDPFSVRTWGSFLESPVNFSWPNSKTGVDKTWIGSWTASRIGSRIGRRIGKNINIAWHIGAQAPLKVICRHVKWFQDMWCCGHGRKQAEGTHYFIIQLLFLF